MRLIYDLSLLEIETLLLGWGEPAYRARQIWEGLYRHFYISPDEFTALPKTLRAKLAENFRFISLSPTPLSLTSLSPISQLASSNQQTVKTLFRLHDGLAIESVLMRYAPRSTPHASPSTLHSPRSSLHPPRSTLCLSTQVGCAMGCVFCATGQMGFERHLSSGEIVAQVMYYARLLKNEGGKVTNVVVMGMGEPFHNYDNTMAAIDRLNDPDGFDFGARRFTISTVGLVPSIRRFAEEKRQVNLAISLHTADDELRASMLPIAKKYPLDELLAACREYTLATGRRVSFEWALIRGVNDTPEQAHRLAKRLHGLLCHVNVIPLNPTRGYGGQAATRQRAQRFREILEQAGVACTIRLRRGVEISAGCGQLAGVIVR